MSVKGTIECLIKVHGADKVQKELDRVRGTVKGTGTAAKDASEQTSGFGGALKSAAGNAAAFIGSFATIGTVISAL